MRHRHLDLPPAVPVEEQPAAAIADLLERGDLDDWRPLATAVARDPFGPLADRVLHLVDAYPRYGTSALWRAWIDRCRMRAEGRRAAAAPPEPLAAVRSRLGLTQSAVARRVAMSQSDLSKFERRSDVRLGTLRAYAAALGARLRITLEFPDRSVELRPPDGARRRPARRTSKPRLASRTRDTRGPGAR
jgi:transcriptional regulator with XRE-family HTH domain